MCVAKPQLKLVKYLFKRTKYASKYKNVGGMDAARCHRLFFYTLKLNVLINCAYSFTVLMLMNI